MRDNCLSKKRQNKALMNKPCMSLRYLKHEKEIEEEKENEDENEYSD